MFKIKQIHILQFTTVLMFVLMVVCGVYILFFDVSKIDAYGRLINILFPVFLTEVIPALIGSPLSKAVENITLKKNQQEGG